MTQEVDDGWVHFRHYEPATEEKPKEPPSTVAHPELEESDVSSNHIKEDEVIHP